MGFLGLRLSQAWVCERRSALVAALFFFLCSLSPFLCSRSLTPRLCSPSSYAIQQKRRPCKDVEVGVTSLPTSTSSSSSSSPLSPGWPLRFLESSSANNHDLLDPMAVLLSCGALQARHFTSSTIKNMKKHIAADHAGANSDLLDKFAATEFFSKYSLRKPDGLVQQYVGKKSDGTTLNSYWRDCDRASQFCHLYALATGEIGVELEQGGGYDSGEGEELGRLDFEPKYTLQRAREIWAYLAAPFSGEDDGIAPEDSFIVPEGDVEVFGEEEEEVSEEEDEDEDEEVDAAKDCEWSEIIQLTESLQDEEISVRFVDDSGNESLSAATVVGFKRRKGESAITVRWKRSGELDCLREIDRGKAGHFCGILVKKSDSNDSDGDDDDEEEEGGEEEGMEEEVDAEDAMVNHLKRETLKNKQTQRANHSFYASEEEEEDSESEDDSESEEGSESDEEDSESDEDGESVKDKRGNESVLEMFKREGGKKRRRGAKG